MSCGVGHRCGLDLAFLWLCCRLVATALIQPLAWELPYAAGSGPRKGKKTKKKKKKSLILHLPSNSGDTPGSHTYSQQIQIGA